ncbi:MAG: hypothetical protein IKM93_06315 [Bacteroidales bacterium]|nr:hypothetical protein [Bacteroidales bacterium]MBR6869410.1 hypothetical protein [Bacteroidales bacterium]
MPFLGHNYFEVLDRVAEETGRQVISYDQIGCGITSWNPGWKNTIL